MNHLKTGILILKNNSDYFNYSGRQYEKIDAVNYFDSYFSAVYF